MRRGFSEHFCPTEAIHWQKLMQRLFLRGDEETMAAKLEELLGSGSTPGVVQWLVREMRENRRVRFLPSKWHFGRIIVKVTVLAVKKRRPPATRTISRPPRPRGGSKSTFCRGNRSRTKREKRAFAVAGRRLPEPAHRKGAHGQARLGALPVAG